MTKFRMIIFLLLLIAGCNGSSEEIEKAGPGVVIPPTDTIKTYTPDTLREATPAESSGEGIVVTDPEPNSTVHSPLTIKGKAKGAWFFEGSFPVALYDDKGNILANGVAHAEGNWMTLFLFR